jgi:hypothetical protein
VSGLNGGYYNIQNDKQETRKRKERVILLKIDEVALSRAASKEGIKKRKAKDYYYRKFEYICVKLLSGLLNNQETMQKTKTEFQF